MIVVIRAIMIVLVGDAAMLVRVPKVERVGERVRPERDERRDDQRQKRHGRRDRSHEKLITEKGPFRNGGGVTTSLFSQQIDRRPHVVIAPRLAETLR